MSVIRTLNILKSFGFTPKNILDIGAYHGNWSKDVCVNVFNDANYTLIEAINYNELHNVCNNFPNFSCINELLYETTTQVNWYEKQNTGDSIFKERTGHFKDCLPVTKNAISLDDLFNNKQMIFDLIKIDCQGAEISILKGGKKLVTDATVIILEIPFVGQYNDGAPNFLEHIQYMNDIGFIPFDIVEHHYIDNIMVQVDIAFIKNQNSILSSVQNKISNCGS
jgi:FkbM family methyltransferase